MGDRHEAPVAADGAAGLQNDPDDPEVQTADLVDPNFLLLEVVHPNQDHYCHHPDVAGDLQDQLLGAADVGWADPVRVLCLAGNL